MTKKLNFLVATLLTMAMVLAVPAEAMAATPTKEATLEIFKAERKNVQNIVQVERGVAVKGVRYTYSINGSERYIDLVDGLVTVTAGGKQYELTNRLVVKDAAMDSNGTVWMLYKNGIVYWWSYDYQKDAVDLKKSTNRYTTGIDSFKIEGDYVTGLNTSTGTVVNLLTLEEQKQVLGITDTPTPQPTPQPDNSQVSQTTPDSTQQSGGQTADQSTGQSTQTTTTTIQSSQTSKKKRPKAAKVIHKKDTYYVYTSKNKLITKFKFKNGKLTWRGWTMKNLKQVGVIKKSINLVVITKKGKAYVFDYDTMKRSNLYNIKKYGKPNNFHIDSNGFADKAITNKPRRLSIKNK